MTRKAMLELIKCKGDCTLDISQKVHCGNCIFWTTGKIKYCKVLKKFPFSAYYDIATRNEYRYKELLRAYVKKYGKGDIMELLI